MKVAKTIKSVRAAIKAARKAGRTIGFVPTMGALHRGHVSLIERSSKHGDFVVVSIFVNPTQFGPKEDLAKYPKPLREDLRICEDNGVDVVFVPDAREMYREKELAWVDVDKISEPLCGRFRPGHFRGVATVCAKLFNIVQPDIAYFGRKDAQQLAVIRRMVADLNFPLKIVGCPTVREADGLALSSRNVYLLLQQRKDATCIYRSLKAAREMIEAGETNPKTIAAKIRKIINTAESLSGIDYISIVDAETLQDISRVTGRVLIAIAARFGSTRLIDNLTVDCRTR
ncbi:MAG: pantoate--beta-alanine ligase [Sedimentisphaerales bacterium]|jgi:pantoate--beta-alanine ligase